MNKEKFIKVLKGYDIDLKQKGFIPTIELLIERLEAEIEVENYAKSTTVHND